MQLNKKFCDVTILIIKLLLILLVGMAVFNLFNENLNNSTIFMFIIWIGMMALIITMNKAEKFKNKNITIISLFASAFIIRIIFCIIWNVVPTNDFLLTYETAMKLADAPIRDWNPTLGLTYTDVYSYITPYVIYEAIIIKIFGEFSILMLSLINIIMSSGTCVLIYKISKKIYKAEKIGIIGGGCMYLTQRFCFL